MVKIKICGITSPEEAGWLLQEKVDYAGIVLFFPKSHRNISCEQAESIIRTLGDGVCKVAVVVSPTLPQIREIEKLAFDRIQIHGEVEQEVLDGLHIPFLRAFNVDNMQELERFRTMDQCVGYVFDAQVAGSGKTFDWTLIPALPEDGKLILLAGGLNPDNVAQALEKLHPDGVDVSSGVERSGGKGKDPAKIRAFVKAVRDWEEGL